MGARPVTGQSLFIVPRVNTPPVAVIKPANQTVTLPTNKVNKQIIRQIRQIPNHESNYPKDIINVFVLFRKKISYSKKYNISYVYYILACRLYSRDLNLRMIQRVQSIHGVLAGKYIVERQIHIQGQRMHRQNRDIQIKREIDIETKRQPLIEIDRHRIRRTQKQINIQIYNHTNIPHSNRQTYRYTDIQIERYRQRLHLNKHTKQIY